MMALMAEEQIAERVRTMRVALGLTQQQLANRGQIDRSYVVHTENGRNKATGIITRRGLARGLALDMDELDALFDGSLDMETAIRRAKVRIAREPAVNDTDPPRAA